ncbi:MAG: class I SAM-dependent methyltransferase [Desulfobacterales bacterium]|nr:class I SAM-dependent methyltransferase [Desulfobacterales bacterium]
MADKIDWREQAQEGILASVIDPADRKGHKNYYIDLLQKIALEEMLEIKGYEVVLDFGCGTGRLSYWIAPRVKKVVGLEITPEMIQLAEKNRTSANVEFMLYDGVHFPAFSYTFDLVLSVGVLQLMKGEIIRKIVSELVEYLKIGGKFCLVEQVSDNPRVSRPRVEDYLQAFKDSKLECLQYYPIRNGRWWLLYLIRYGIISKKFFPEIARKEILRRRGDKQIIFYYQDYLFLLQRK